MAEPVSQRRLTLCAWVKYQDLELAEGNGFKELVECVLGGTGSTWLGSYTVGAADCVLQRACLLVECASWISEEEWRKRFSLDLEGKDVPEMEFKDASVATPRWLSMREADVALYGDRVCGYTTPVAARASVRSYLLRGENG